MNRRNFLQALIAAAATPALARADASWPAPAPFYTPRIGDRITTVPGARDVLNVWHVDMGLARPITITFAKMTGGELDGELITEVTNPNEQDLRVSQVLRMTQLEPPDRDHPRMHGIDHPRMHGICASVSLAGGGRELVINTGALVVHLPSAPEVAIRHASEIVARSRTWTRV